MNGNFDSDIAYEGFLVKKAVRTPSKNSWAKRWITLKKSGIIEYCSKKYGKPKFKLRLEAESKITILDHEDPPANHSGKKNELKIEAKDGHCLFACAKSQEELMLWYEAFQITLYSVQQKVSFEEAYEMLQEKERQAKEEEASPLPKQGRVISMADAVQLARTNFAEVYAIGNGNSGQLGIGEEVGGGKCTPVRIEAFHTQPAPKSVACGRNFSMVISCKDKVMAWGKNSHGQLGLNEVKTSLRPVIVPALRSLKVRSIACGSHHAIICNTEGEVYCWGSNKYGQCGSGRGAIPVDQLNSTQKAIDALGPTTISQPSLLSHFGRSSNSTRGHIPAGVLIDKVFAGVDATAAIDSRGSVFVWGNNNQGKLGVGKELIDASLGFPHKPKSPRDEDLDQLRFIKVAFSSTFSLWVTVPKSTDGVIIEDQDLNSLLRRRRTTVSEKEKAVAANYQDAVQRGVAEELLQTIEQACEEVDVSDTPMLPHWAPWYPGSFEGRLHICGRAGISIAEWKNNLDKYSRLFYSKEFGKQMLVTDIAAGIAHATAISRGRVFTIGYGWLGLTNDNGIELPNADSNSQAVKDCAVLGVTDSSQQGSGQLASDMQLVSSLQLESLICSEVGDKHTMALSANGHVYGWGECMFGQLGTGKYLSRPVPFSATPVLSIKGFHAKLLGVGAEHTLSVWHQGDPKGESRDRVVVRKACEQWWNKTMNRIRESLSDEVLSRIPKRTFTGSGNEVDKIDKDAQTWGISQTVKEISGKYGLFDGSLHVRDNREEQNARTAGEQSEEHHEVNHSAAAPLEVEDHNSRDAPTQEQLTPSTSDSGAEADETVIGFSGNTETDEKQASVSSTGDRGSDSDDQESHDHPETEAHMNESGEEPDAQLSLAERRKQRRETIRQSVKEGNSGHSTVPIGTVAKRMSLGHDSEDANILQ